MKKWVLYFTFLIGSLGTLANGSADGSGSGSGGGFTDTTTTTDAEPTTCPSQISTSYCCSEDPSWGASGFQVTQCGCEGMPEGQCTASAHEHRCVWVADFSLDATCSALLDATECEGNDDCSWESAGEGDDGACHYMGCYDRSCDSLDNRPELVAKRPDCHALAGLAFRNTKCSCADTRDLARYCPCLDNLDACEDISGCHWHYYGCTDSASTSDASSLSSHSEFGMIWLTAIFVLLGSLLGQQV